ncbi:ATP-binding protein [Streptomyces olivaceoviridis]
MSATTGVTIDGTTDGVAEIIQVDRALESWRDAGFDLTAAAGEVVDNSIEAGATSIQIRTFPEGANVKKIEEMAFADDGNGIDPSILANVLSLGFSTRYNQRSGLGRFGVGLKLATLSHAKRIDIYTRVHGDDAIWHTFVDLDLIRDGEQKVIEREKVDCFPEQYADLLRDSNGDLLASGTLVLWSKIDRLMSGGRFKNDLKQRLVELQTFLARAYRKFIDTSGLRIEFNGRHITLHDPLFELDNPRLAAKVGDDARGQRISREVIKIDGQEVVVTVTLAPEALIQPRFKGDAPILKDFHIHTENQGKISFIRQGREINYEIVPRMLPSGVQDVDRYIGIQVEFPATLDEYFQVRHVKRGVEPVDKLRQELRTKLKAVINAARKTVQERWDAIDDQERLVSDDHDRSTKAVTETEKTAPRGRAGAGLTPEQESEMIEHVIEELQLDFEAGIDDEKREQKAQKLREAFTEDPISLADGTWHHTELFGITHLNGRAILKINHGHPFFREIFDPVKEMAKQPATEADPAAAFRLLRRVDTGIELLLMAYAKAENMHHEPDVKFTELRAHWGQFSSSYLRSALKDSD